MKYTQLKTLSTFLLFSIISLSYSQNQTYFTLASDIDSLFVLGNDGNIQSHTLVTEISGLPVNGFTGMALDPTTSIVYIIVKYGTNNNRYLATLNTSSSTATKISNLSDKISSIAFDNSGQLFGITGDGGNNPNRFYSIDKSNSSLTELADLSGDFDGDGEAISYNSIDGFMYRLAGEEFLYKIDMTSFNTTLVSNSLYDSGASGHALYFNGIDFISLSQYICTMSSLGQQTDCNEVDLDFKGILPSNITSISEIKDSPKRLVKVLDLLGRETKIKNNMLLIYQYSDGSSEKIFKIGE
jgi:hypothetical protein